MQTFLPFADYNESAACLDKLRLNKQITEARQILGSLYLGGGWKNHPAVKAWVGYGPSLVEYTWAMYKEFVARGGTPDHKSWAFVSEHWGDLKGPKPAWVGYEPLHSSHRGRLLHKGNLDILRKRIKTFAPKPDLVCKVIYGVRLRDLTVSQCSHLHSLLDEERVEMWKNWYEQFGWSEEPCDDYVWVNDKVH